MSQLKNYLKTNKLLVILSVIFSFFALLMTFSYTNFDVFFNSDSLYLPSIYNDIFGKNGYGLGGWQFNPSPNFFPDMIVYFLLDFICGGNFIWASYLYSVIQYFAIIYLIYRTLILFIKKENARFSISFGMLFLSLILIPLVGDSTFASNLITNSFHLGALINTLLAFILLDKYLSNKSKKTFYWLLALVFIATLSDKLFIVQFVFVVLGILGYNWLILKNPISKTTFKKTGILILSFIAAIVFFNLLRDIDYINFSNSAFMFSFEKTGESFAIFADQMRELLLRNVVGAITVIIPFLSLLFSGIYLIKNRKTTSKKYHFILGIFFFLGLTLVSPIINGAYEGTDCIRYNIAFFIIGYFVLPFLLSESKIVTVILKSTWIIGFVFISYFIVKHDFKRTNDFFTYQPKEASSLDYLKVKHDLKCGISEYWHTKKNMMFSVKNVRIYSVYDDFSLYTHVTNRNWFRESQQNRNEPAVFNFVFIDSDKTMEMVKTKFRFYEVFTSGNVTICKTPEFYYPKGQSNLEFYKP